MTELPMNRRIAITLIAFVLGAVLMDRVAGWGLRVLFERTETGDTGGFANHVIASADADIFLFGSSRTSRHVDSARMSEALGLSVYNAGVDGQGLPVARMLEALVLSADATPPRLIVLQVDPNELFSPRLPRSTIMTPFAGNPDVRDVLYRIDPMLRYKLMSASYPFNSKLFGMVRNQGRAVPRDQYLPLEHQTPNPTPAGTDDAEVAPLVYDGPMDATAQALLREFVAAADAAGTRTLLIVGPAYRVGPLRADTTRAYAFYEELASAHASVIFEPLDERALPELVQQSLFADVAHLNRAGAERYTDVLVDVVRPLLTSGATPTP